MPPLQAVDVSPSGVEPWLETVSWLILLVIIASSITFLAIIRYRVYDRDQRRQLSALRAGEMRADPPTIPVRRRFDPDQLREDLLRVWKRGDPPRVRSVRGAVRELRAGVAATIPSAPPLIRNGIIEAFAIAVLSVAMMVPIRWLEALGDPVGAISILQTRFGGATPGVGPIETVLQYGVSAALLTGVLIWQVWVLISILLVLGGIGLLHLRSTDDDRWVGVATKAYGGLVAIGALVLLAKIGVAILDGYLVAWVRAWFPVGFAVTLVLLIAGIWLLARFLPGAFDELGAAIQTVTRSIALRGVVISRGLPYAAVLITALILLAWIPTPDPWAHRAYTVPLLTWAGIRYVGMIVVLAVTAGLIARFGTWIWGQIRYRAVDPRDLRGAGIPEVHLRPYALEDADGEPILVCRVDDERLAHRDQGELLEDVLEATHGMHESGHRRSRTFSDYYGELLDRGIVDESVVRKSLRGELKADTKSTVARGDGNPPRVDEDALEAYLRDRYPPDASAEVLDELRRRGEIDRRRGEVVYQGD